ncbi:hypothetical protein ACWDLL_21770 [Streptomyces griseoincarnatus]|uniref:hypothetical protein n=1 Tax=Streptomyces sp. BSE7-9 TaxID=2759948 RepID=UPI0018EE59F9|nr:hypothetical protein [Streptomyces sp. BSE7-9]MBJ6642443.1 hypothetical protein [Streptomyces sp. BSE7-9]
MSGGEARQDTRAGSAPPSAPADDEQPVRSTMAVMFSLEDDLTVVAGLNERLATLNGALDADPGEQVRSQCCTISATASVSARQ